MNLRPPSVTVSTHTSAFNAIAFQSPAMVHSFSFPPRPLRTAPSRFPKTIRFGSRPPRSFGGASPPTEVFLSFATSSQCSHARLSQGHGCTESSNLVSCAPRCNGCTYMYRHHIQSMSRFTGLQFTGLPCLPVCLFRATPSPWFTGGMSVYRGG